MPTHLSWKSVTLPSKCIQTFLINNTLGIKSLHAGVLVTSVFVYKIALSLSTRTIDSTLVSKQLECFPNISSHSKNFTCQNSSWLCLQDSEALTKNTSTLLQYLMCGSVSSFQYPPGLQIEISVLGHASWETQNLS